MLFKQFQISYRRQWLNKLQHANASRYHGVVLDIGGRDRGGSTGADKNVDKWIYADIEKSRNPDLVLDVADMHVVEDGSIDVVNAFELFEHVEKIDEGLNECYRVLKPGGTMILTVPFLSPIHGDPYDFQRWTQTRWEKELTARGFAIEQFHVTGTFFTIHMDMVRAFIKQLPRLVRLPFLILIPLMNVLASLDQTRWIQKNPKLRQYHAGYFIIAQK